MANQWFVNIQLIALYATASATDEVCLLQTKEVFPPKNMTLHGLIISSSHVATGFDNNMRSDLAEVYVQSTNPYANDKDVGQLFCHKNPMHLWPNYSIFITAWLLALWLHVHPDPSKPWYEEAMKWHFFTGVASFFGGIVHTTGAYYGSFEELCAWANEILPSWFIGFVPEQIQCRCWFISMIGILLTEFYMVTIFFGSWANVYPWIKQYLIAVVAFGCFLNLLSGSYFSIVLVHAFSMSIGGSLAIWLGNYALAAGMAILLLSGIVWKLQESCILGTPFDFHYNDIYHLFCTLAQLFAHWVIVETKYIDRIHQRANDYKSVDTSF